MMLLHDFRQVFLLVAIAAGAGATVLGAGETPLAVFQRVLVMPSLPVGSEVPMNIPQDGAVKMPWVAGGAPGVARRINDAVWREVLDVAPAPDQPGDTFTPPPDQLPQGTVSLDFRVEFIPVTKPRLLSLDFSGEACGAYCEDFNHTRVFDLRDGRQLTLADLLSAKGFVAVGRQVDAQRRNAYRKQVRQLKASPGSASGAPMIRETDDADRLALNEECLRRVTTEPSTPEWLMGYSFKLDSLKGLVLSIGRCSNHASRALDDVGEITVTIAPRDLKTSLTPYGLVVVLQQGDALPSAHQR